MIQFWLKIIIAIIVIVIINSDNDNDSDSDCETKQIDNHFKIIDESQSFEDQIKLLKKSRLFRWVLDTSYYDDNKELNLKIVKLKFAYISKYIDENLFEEVFGHTLVTLANKLINTTNTEENQIIINDLKK